MPLPYLLDVALGVIGATRVKVMPLLEAVPLSRAVEPCCFQGWNRRQGWIINHLDPPESQVADNVK